MQLLPSNHLLRGLLYEPAVVVSADAVAPPVLLERSAVQLRAAASVVARSRTFTPVADSKNPVVTQAICSRDLPLRPGSHLRARLRNEVPERVIGMQRRVRAEDNRYGICVLEPRHARQHRGERWLNQRSAFTPAPSGSTLASAAQAALSAGSLRHRDEPERRTCPPTYRRPENDPKTPRAAENPLDARTQRSFLSLYLLTP